MLSLTGIRLVVLDLDGTLVEAFTETMLYRVHDTLTTLAGIYKDAHWAIASNEGGTGLRHWMQVGKFGTPDKYRTMDEARARMARVAAALPLPTAPLTLMCFAYQGKGNRWAPTPADQMGNPEWSVEWRKPRPGMLLFAMHHFGVTPEETLMIGDSNEDSMAAVNAGCKFAWAIDVFAPDPVRSDSDVLAKLKGLDFDLD